MSQQRIVVIEDENDILAIVTYNLVKEDYRVIGISSGEKAVNTVRSEVPDLVVLDLMLPGIDGLEVCRRLKALQETKDIPIIILTAKGEEQDVVTGLEAGADDYVTKPFSPKVLIARIKAVLRRKSKGQTDEAPSIKIRDLVIYPVRHEVLLKNKPIQLTVTEFRILYLLARRTGWVFTRQQIIDSVHGDDHFVTDRSIDFQIVGLRKKLRSMGRYIETVRGVGYRFKD